MKKYLFPLLLITTVFIAAGCHKSKQPDTANSNNSTVTRDPDDHPIFYSIKGLHDVIVNRGIDTTVNMPLSIGFYPSKVGVSINIENLPQGVTASPRSLTVYDSFDTTIVFRIKMDSVGVFRINVNGASTYPGRYPSNGSAHFDITVK